MPITNDEIKFEVDESKEEEAQITYDIASYPSDLTLSVIYEMWKAGDITIPEFQREFVWTIKQSSLLIESFLLGLPVPPLFFYIDEKNRNLVVDGHQRLRSIIFYFEGFFGSEGVHGKKQVFHLEGLAPGSKFSKKTFNDLSEEDKRKLRNTVLRAINIKQLKPVGESTSIYHIFERLNTGGTPLKPQEIRNVVFRGEIVTILRSLNRDKNWRKILGKPNINRFQVDVELVLRLLAFSNGAESYEKPMKDFLNKAMKHNQNGTTPEIIRFESLFSKVTELVIQEFGEKPFHVRGPLSTSTLDSVFCTLFEFYETLPSDLDLRFKNLLANGKFEELTKLATTDASIVKERFKLVEKMLIK